LRGCFIGLLTICLLAVCMATGVQGVANTICTSVSNYATAANRTCAARSRLLAWHFRFYFFSPVWFFSASFHCPQRRWVGWRTSFVPRSIVVTALPAPSRRSEVENLYGSLWHVWEQRCCFALEAQQASARNVLYCPGFVRNLTWKNPPVRGSSMNHLQTHPPLRRCLFTPSPLAAASPC